MKLKYYLPLLLLAIIFTSCVERTERVVHQDTIAPEYSVEEETLKSRVSAIIPSENISFGSEKTTKSGEAGYNTIKVKIVPDTLPENGIAFNRLTDEIQEAVESGISNLEDYQKMNIEVRRTVEENEIEHTQFYKKEFDL